MLYDCCKYDQCKFFRFWCLTDDDFECKSWLKEFGLEELLDKLEQIQHQMHEMTSLVRGKICRNINGF